MLTTWGYDYFIGNAVDASGKKTLICFDFNDNCIDDYLNLYNAGSDLYYLVRNNKRVLLHQSPGIRKELVMSIEEMSEYVKGGGFTKLRENIQTAIDPNRGHVYIRPELRFETLRPMELNIIKKTYYELPKIKDYRDPFEIQPHPADLTFISRN